MEATTCGYGSWFSPAFCCHSRQIRAWPLCILDSQVVMGSWNTCIFPSLGRHNQPDLTFTITNQKTFSIKKSLLCWPRALSWLQVTSVPLLSQSVPAYLMKQLWPEYPSFSLGCTVWQLQMKIYWSRICLAVGRLSHRKGIPGNLQPGQKVLPFVVVMCDVSRVGYKEWRAVPSIFFFFPYGQNPRKLKMLNWLF